MCNLRWRTLTPEEVATALKERQPYVRMFEGPAVRYVVLEREVPDEAWGTAWQVVEIR